MASDTSLRQVPLSTLRRVNWPPCCRCCVRVGTLVAFFVAGICYIWSCASAQRQWLRRFPDRKDSFEEPYTLGDTSVLRIMTSGLILISEGYTLNSTQTSLSWHTLVALCWSPSWGWWSLTRVPGDSSQPLYYGIYLATQLDPYASVFDLCKILLLVNVLM